MKKLFFFFLIFLLVLIVPVVAVKPVTETGVGFDEGFEIEFPPFNTFEQGETIKLNFHVFNISNGHPISEGISCNFDLYNSSGFHLIDEDVSEFSSTFDISIIIEDGNFSQLGHYGYVIGCNNSMLGGFSAHSLDITASGTDEENSHFLLLLCLIPLIIGFFSLIGSFFLGDDHKEFKVGLFLFSFVTFFSSMWLAYTIVAIQFPNMKELLNALGTLTWIFGIIITVMIVYFMLYILYKAFRQAAQEERDKDIEY